MKKIGFLATIKKKNRECDNVEENKVTDAKKKVEELKQRNEEAKEQAKIKKTEEQLKINKIDEQEILQKKQINPTDKPLEKLKGHISNIGIFIRNLKTSFLSLEPAIQLCIIIPIVIILIVVVNKIYTNNKTTTLTCTNTTYTTSLKTEEEIKFVFKDGRIYSQKRQMTYEILNKEVKTLGQLETDKRDSNEELNEIKGIKASYKVIDDKLVNTIEYNFYKMESDTIEELGLDQNGDLSTYKERFVNFGYDCEE